MLSPIITPLILIFKLSNKSQEIVDFFRNFTVDVVGVGDVCSFAQMDVRRHGNPAWQVEDVAKPAEDPVARTNGYTQAEDGKTEMSLVHFTLTNPGWKPSGDNEKYLSVLKTAATADVVQLSTMPEDTENPMYSSITGLEDMGGSYKDHAHNVLGSMTGGRPPGPVPSPPPDTGATSYTSPILRGGISRCTGPLISSRSFLGPLPSLSNMSSRLMTPSIVSTGHNNAANLELSQADMAMSALYLHNVNHRTRHHHHRPTIEQVSGYRFQRDTVEDTEDRDLLLPSLSSSS